MENKISKNKKIILSLLLISSLAIAVPLIVVFAPSKKTFVEKDIPIECFQTSDAQGGGVNISGIDFGDTDPTTFNSLRIPAQIDGEDVVGFLHDDGPNGQLNFSKYLGGFPYTSEGGDDNPENFSLENFQPGATSNLSLPNIDHLFFDKDSKLKKINDYAFSHCGFVNHIVIPDSVSQIGTKAFWDCRLATGVTFTSFLNRIYGASFANWLSATDPLIFPKTTAIDPFISPNNFNNPSFYIGGEPTYNAGAFYNYGFYFKGDAVIDFLDASSLMIFPEEINSDEWTKDDSTCKGVSKNAFFGAFTRASSLTVNIRNYAASVDVVEQYYLSLGNTTNYQGMMWSTYAFAYALDTAEGTITRDVYATLHLDAELTNDRYDNTFYAPGTNVNTSNAFGFSIDDGGINSPDKYEYFFDL